MQNEEAELAQRATGMAFYEVSALLLFGEKLFRDFHNSILVPARHIGNLLFANSYWYCDGDILSACAMRVLLIEKL